MLEHYGDSEQLFEIFASALLLIGLLTNILDDLSSLYSVYTLLLV